MNEEKSKTIIHNILDDWDYNNVNYRNSLKQILF